MTPGKRPGCNDKSIYGAETKCGAELAKCSQRCGNPRNGAAVSMAGLLFPR
nr:MAG TPA: hypothetical protein [Caudoviricetes sp.]